MVQLRNLRCENCGASVEWDGMYGKTLRCNYCGSTFRPAATEMEEVWMMTDPVARARYELDGKLDKLEHDIRYEVMRGKDWSRSDMAYLAEMNRLEQENLVRKLASFWAVSPHPPIYRSLADGKIVLGEESVIFHEGDEIIWACPMTRDRFGLNLPVLIGDFQDARIQRMCGEMMDAMQSRIV